MGPARSRSYKPSRRGMTLACSEPENRSGPPWPRGYNGAQEMPMTDQDNLAESDAHDVVEVPEALPTAGWRMRLVSTGDRLLHRSVSRLIHLGREMPRLRSAGYWL